MNRRVLRAASRRAPWLVLGLGLSLTAAGDSTTLTIAGASVNTTSQPTTLNFPVTRTGDTSYDAWLSYTTQDHTAIAGTDYTAAHGQVLIPAGASSTTIPVTVAPNISGTATKYLRLLATGGQGSGTRFSFNAGGFPDAGLFPVDAVAADFNGDGKPELTVLDGQIRLDLTGSNCTIQPANPSDSLAVADFNGDGKPDLVTAGRSSDITVLLNSTMPGATCASFTQTSIAPAAGSAYAAIAVADLDGDGRPDLVLSSGSGNAAGSVVLLLNTTPPGAATASFGPPTTLDQAGVPWRVAVGDFNGDGKPDLALAVRNLTTGGGTLSVLFNTTAPGAAASFASAFSQSDHYTSVQVGDFDGDGKPDLLAYDNGAAAFLLDRTAPGSASASFVPVDSNVTVTGTVGDFDGDGKADLAVVIDQNSFQVSVLQNVTVPGAPVLDFVGLGGFPPAPASPRSTRSRPDSETVSRFVTAQLIADIDGDGRPDLTSLDVTYFSQEPGYASADIRLNRTPPGAPNASFTAAAGPAAGSAPQALAAGDFNGDGKPDLVVANSAANTVSVLFDKTAQNSFSGSYALAASPAVGNAPAGVAVADFNGDGKPDLAVANSADNTVSVLFNTTTTGAASVAHFSAAGSPAAGNAPLAVVAADFNGDGRPDLAVADSAGNAVSILLNTTAPGATAASFAPAASVAAGSAPSALVVGDFNRDGRPDLAVANSGDNTVSLLFNTTAPGAPAASFASAGSPASGSAPAAIATGDFNNDGAPDLAVANSGDNTVSFLFNTTAARAASASFVAGGSVAVGSVPRALAVGSFHGGGLADVAVANRDGNSLSILRNGTAQNALAASFTVVASPATGTRPYALAIGDFNGDGVPDLAAANVVDNTVSVLFASQYQTIVPTPSVYGTIHQVKLTVPAMPTGVTAAPGIGQVTLNWSAAAGAVTYAVYQGTSPGDEAATPVRSGVSGTSVTLTGLQDNTAYYFRIAGENAGVTGPQSAEVSATPQLPAPTGLAATVGSASGSVTLNWNASAGAVGYNIYQGTNANSTVLVKGSVTGTTITLMGLSNGTTYFFRVAGENGQSDVGALSGAVSATPLIPTVTGLTAVSGSGKVTLSWNGVAGATSYNVYQGTTPGGEAATPVRSGSAVRTVAITGLSNGVPYYFTVAAVDASGIGAHSAEASATPGPPPPAPTGVAAVQGDGLVNLSWNASAGALSYSVYQGTTAGGEAATPVRTGITGTGATIGGLINGTRYYFQVVAVNTSGTSPRSAEVNARPAVPPAPPTGLGAAAGSARVSLSWTASAGATSYNVYAGTAAGHEAATPLLTGVTASNAVVGSLVDGTLYYFKVAALNGASTSDLSSEASAKPIAAPTGVTAAPGTGKVTLSWNAVTGATSYNVFQGTTPGGESAAPVKSGAVRIVAISGLTKGVTYYFRINAVNATGASDPSAEVSATAQ